MGWANHQVEDVCEASSHPKWKTYWNCIRFITSFEVKVDPFGLVEILVTVIDAISEKKDAVAFIEKLKHKVKICDKAIWLCKVYLEHLNDLEATKKIIEDLKDVFVKANNITPLHGKYYMLASQYYRVVSKHAEYSRCGLQFLGCSIDEFLGLAALLGDFAIAGRHR